MMPLLPHSVRRRLKRRRFARAARDAEATAFTTGAPIWPRLRRWNDMIHVWDRHPDGPRHR